MRTPDWRLIVRTDFDEADLPAGPLWQTGTRPEDAGLFPAGNPWAAVLKGKADGPIGNGDLGHYACAATHAVRDSWLRIRNHRADDGRWLSGSVKPVLPGPNAVDRTFLRVRFRARLTGDPHAGAVATLINPRTWDGRPSGVPNGGEVCFPEIRPGGGHQGFFHPARLGIDPRTSRRLPLPGAVGEPHVYDLAWTTDAVRGLVDDVEAFRLTEDVPQTALGWVIQTGWPQEPERADAEAVFAVDWIEVYDLG